MKKFKLPTVPAIVAILLLAVVFNSQAQNYGSHNILIGKNAGASLTFESYCVIVGHDSTAINAKGKNLIWHVDWNEPYLNDNPAIKKILQNYEDEIILKGKDNEDYRMVLVRRILTINNVAIGSNALYFKSDTMKNETIKHKTPDISIQGDNEVFIGIKSVMETKLGCKNVGFGEKQMQSCFYVKELECYIDLTKIVEISTLKQMPIHEQKTGFYSYLSGYFESENFQKQGWFYFTITYQLRTPVKHWIDLPQKDSEKVYSRVLSAWIQSLNKR